MRLIDEDEAFKVLSAYYKHRTPVQNSALHDALSRVPTVDAVPVIRCKDCKHWQKSVINYNEYVCYWGGYVKKEDDFCSWAERKE